MSSTLSCEPTEGIALVFTQCEPDVTTGEFNDWFDKQNENLAQSMIPQTPGASVRRLKATGGETPEWLAMYDLSSIDATKASEHAQLWNAIDEAGSTIISHLPMHQRYVYTFLGGKCLKPSALPAKYILIVGWSIPDHLEKKFNEWYDKEHMDDAAKLPGFIRGRRYKLLEKRRISPNGPEAFPYNHLIVLEWENEEYWEIIRQGKYNTSTKEMIAAGEGLTTRRYEVYRDF